MQLFPEFNAKMNGRSFDADAFTVLYYLGLHHFCNLVGATNMGFRKGNGKRLTYLRMDLQPNEGGFDRLKIFYQPDDTVRMEFYMFTPMPGGMKSIKGPVTVYENVSLEYMFQAFREATGLELEGDEPETV